MERPFWWPDQRGWASASAFALMVFVVCLSARYPSLMDHQLWVQLVTALAIGNGGLIINFYFGSSKGSSDNAQRADDANARADKALTVASKDTSK